MSNDIKLGITLNYDGKSLTSGVAINRKDLDELTRAASGTGNVLKDMWANLTAGKAALLGATAGVTYFAKEVVQAGIGADKITQQLKFVSGSATAAAAEMEYLRVTTSKLGVDFMSSAQAYGKLSASSKGTAMEGERTRAVFESVSKASVVMGLSAEETNGALLAISQMMSKGAVQSEELRGQLGERLPGAFQIAARAMGVTTSELGKLLESGDVVASSFLPRFAAELERTLGDSPQSAAASAQAQLNRLNSSWDQFKQALASSGILEIAANGFRILGAAIDSVNMSSVAQVSRLKSELARLEQLLAGEKAMGETDQAQRTEAMITAARRRIAVLQDEAKANLVKKQAESSVDYGAAKEAARARAVADATRVDDEAVRKYLENTDRMTEAQKRRKALTDAEKLRNRALADNPGASPAQKANIEAAYQEERRQIEEKFSKEARALSAAQADANIARAKSAAGNYVEMYKAEYDGFRLSTEAFIASTLALKQRAIAAEIEILQRRSATAKPEERVAISGKIDALKLDSQKLGSEAAAETEKAAREAQAALEKLSVAGGKALDPLAAAGLQFGKDFGDLIQRALADGLAGEERLAAAARAWANISAVTQFNTGKARFEGIAKDLEASLANIRLASATGSLSAVDALVGEKAVRDKAVEDMQRVHAEVQAIAASIADPAVRASLGDLSKKLAEVKMGAREADFSNWTVGADNALKKYQQSALDVSGATEQAFTRGFQGMEDAVVQFSQTGKLNFSSLANSIVADLIRIQIRAAMSSATSSIGGFGGLLQMFGFGGGGSITGPATGSVVANTPSTYSIPIASANGNVFSDSPSLHQYVNTVQTSPKVFGYQRLHPYAHGGVFAEAGPEAVMPLARDSSGRLGVRSQGGGVPEVNVVINNSMADKAETTVQPRMNNGRFEIEVLVEQVVARDQRQNGPMTQGFANTFGLARAV